MADNTLLGADKAPENKGRRRVRVFRITIGATFGFAVLALGADVVNAMGACPEGCMLVTTIDNGWLINAFTLLLGIAAGQLKAFNPDDGND